MAQAKSTPPSTHRKDASGRRGRIDVHMTQNVLLIWLDASIDKNSSDYQDTINHLRRTVNTIQIFTDSQECLHFLEDLADEKACMIISGSLGQLMVPLLHNLSQVDSIFIFCGNKKFHEEWAKDWSKIKGVDTDIGPICEALTQAAQQCEQNAISMSIMGGGEEKSADRLDPSFMYTQLMKEIFLTINFEQQHIDKFIKHCCEALGENTNQLKYVDQLAHQYRQKTPIWWYTSECLLYPMLNRAFRLMDANVMVKMGFFIGDLHRHIEELHQQQFGGRSSQQQFTVYRGQGMDKEAYNKMVANKDGLISFNSFLTTSKVRSTSLKFAQRALANDQMVGVLFVMDIDPARSSTPFASIVDVGYFGKKEDEVLFSMNSIFRIGEITPVDGNTHLVQVQLNLTSDKDNDLRELIDCVRKETFRDDGGWFRLGQVLWQMGESAEAARVYEILLRQETKESTKGPICHQLGLMKQQQGDYPEAIAYYEKSIKIEEKQIPRNDLSLASSYNNIGGVYRSMGDYPKALSSHEKALAIRQQSLPPTHPSLASSYNNMGLVHENMGNYSKAHSYFERAVDIGERSLPANHPILQKRRDNLADIKKKL